jgi:glycosyltransferase involved in cell wall biosynthesis
MLGWEFPPFISGGLGTACYGLTKALSAIGQDVMFVLPRPVATPFSTHVRLVSPRPDSPLASPSTEFRLDEFERVAFRTVESNEPGSAPVFPYSRPDAGEPRTIKQVIAEKVVEKRAVVVENPAPMVEPAKVSTNVGPAEQKTTEQKASEHKTAEQKTPDISSPGSHYAGDLFAEVQRYAALATQIARQEQFDVVHAHDWMTYPAGLAVAAATNKPLVVHVHSTEFDRAGLHVDQRIYDIERRGMHAAVRVIAVSHLTKSLCTHHYGVDDDKVEVVHNAIEFNGNGHGPLASFDPEKYKIHDDERIVLFLGRITMQKGPEYFLAAAKKVLEVMDNVKFVMAGSGDMIRRTIELAAQMGIGHKVLFTGFLRGADVERVFKMADLYVMPSVSEPFGIAPLEAMSNDVPVIISKQSGVSEVLQHALKVDFWDVSEMANKIVAVLRHPPLSQSLKQHGSFEVRKLSWNDAARSCVHVYEQAMRTLAPVPE